MPITFDITSNLVNKDTAVPFLNTEKNEKAKKDFMYLATQSNMSYSVKLNHVCLSNSKSSFIADVAVLAATTKDSVVEIPADVIRNEENNYVGVVLYNDENVVGVYLHKTSEVMGKNGMFSNYKYNKKTNSYGIKVANYKKWDTLKFGIVLSNYISM